MLSHTSLASHTAITTGWQVAYVITTPTFTLVDLIKYVQLPTLVSRQLRGLQYHYVNAKLQNTFPNSVITMSIYVRMHANAEKNIA